MHSLLDAGRDGFLPYPRVRSRQKHGYEGSVFYSPGKLGTIGRREGNITSTGGATLDLMPCGVEGSSLLRP